MNKIGGGPLAGIRIVLMGGIGPAPFGAMLLGDLGADVVRVDRPGDVGRPQFMTRNQRSVVLDLKQERGVAAAMALVERADAVVEGFRPGVMEHLGLGPQEALARNPKLVYARMTGWGQDGPLAQVAGHDLNYVALSGALHAIGTAHEPVIPLNLVGDFGGGALYLCMGVLSGVISARSTGRGQVVDCAMVEGAASLMTLFYSLRSAGRWGERGTNLLDGGAHFYNVYRCSDDRWISVGAIEPQFYALLCEKLGLPQDMCHAQNDKSLWPQRKALIAEFIGQRTRDEWSALLEGTDVCFAPVLDLHEAPQHRHNVARDAFVDVEGELQPSPTPRFSGTPNAVPRAPSAVGADTAQVFHDWGVAPLDQTIHKV